MTINQAHEKFMEGITNGIPSTTKPWGDKFRSAIRETVDEEHYGRVFYQFRTLARNEDSKDGSVFKVSSSYDFPLLEEAISKIVQELPGGRPDDVLEKKPVVHITVEAVSDRATRASCSVTTGDDTVCKTDVETLSEILEEQSGESQFFMSKAIGAAVIYAATDYLNAATAAVKAFKE